MKKHHRMVHTSLSSAGGFTLLELLVAMGIFSVIIGLVVTNKFTQQEAHITGLQAVEMQQSARTAMLLMKKELRKAGFNDLPNDYGQGISAMNAGSITFSSVADDAGTLNTVSFVFQDVDGDGNSEITVEYNGGGPQILAENIQNLTLTYLDGNGAVTGTASSVRSIQISVTSTVNSNHLVRNAGNATRTLTSRVFMRNMGI